MNLEEKKRKKVNFDSSKSESKLDSILQSLHQIFEAHSVSLPRQFSNTQTSIDEQEDHFPHKLDYHISKELQSLYEAVARLLTKELTCSLQSINQEILDRDSQSYSSDIATLIIYYSILKLRTVTSKNCYKLLKLVYDLTLMECSLQISNLKSSITKKLIKLGFALLNLLRNSVSRHSSSSSHKSIKSQSSFTESVAQFIKQKEAQVLSMKFQVCRICEMPIETRFITSHSKFCEQRHQMKYYKQKLQEKGKNILIIINDLQKGSLQEQELRLFFHSIFRSFNDKIVTFSLEGEVQGIVKIIQRYKDVQNQQNYQQTLELLLKYKELLGKDVDDTLSDKGSTTVKSRYHIKYAYSNTSFNRDSQPSSEPDSICQDILSDKTITYKDYSQGLHSYHQIKFNDFQILKSIGKGSYSEVYLVRKRETRDLYAMKVIKIQNLDEETMHALKKQQKIYKSITGGYNVKLYYSFCQDNLYFLILDFGCGGSLRNLLEEEVYFQEKDVKTYLANLMMAVDSIHRIGIVHRDLKPDNLVINELGQLILTDFNLSKLVKDLQIQKQGTFYGTPDYIAPEILRELQTDKTIDWFSVGVIAYEMVIGVTPFTDMTPQKVFQNILKGQIEWPQEQQGSGVSYQCKEIILALLHSDPSKRFGANLNTNNAGECQLIQEMKKFSFFNDLDLTKIKQFLYFYIPNSVDDYEENTKLKQEIESKKRKMSHLSLETDCVVRYDILKSATNKHVKSQRNSRFKIEKELEVLKQLMPSSHNINYKKHNSFNNLNMLGSFTKQDKIGVSCKNFQENQNQMTTQI